MSTPDDLQELYLRVTFDLVAYEAFDHLHWGLWRDVPKEPRRFAEARQAYADELVSWISTERSRVLDVGCGLGGVAKMLADRGHRVTALTPRADHHQRLVAHPVNGLEPRLARFEELEGGTFDLILFGESFNFFAHDVPGTLARVASLLAPGGQLLVAELFAPATSVALERAGWSTVRTHDVTDEVAFTVDALQAACDRYLRPYRDLHDAALRAVDGDLAAKVTEALADVPNRAVASLLRGHVVEEDMLTHARYLFCLLEPPP